MLSVDEIVAGIRGQSRRALAKGITLVESALPAHQDQAQQLLEALLPHTGGALRLGITGVPGVGKSTFIEALGMHLIREGHRVAVLAVDPSSSVSGGSILGDKTRMAELAAAPAAFIRPSPSGGTLGGVGRRTREALLLCEAFGFDVVIVETVGVGQSEFVVSSLVDFFLVLMLAGAGDELQGIKRGILEIADAVAINKADGENMTAAARAQAEYAMALRLMRGKAPWVPPVLKVSALEATGLEELWDVISRHRARARASGELEERRARQADTWFWALLEEGLKQSFLDRSDVREAMPQLRDSIAARRITPTRAASELLRLLG